MGALLFDIGMTKIPKELLYKTSPFTSAERAAMEKHTEEGFNIIRAQHDISRCPLIVLFSITRDLMDPDTRDSLKVMRFMNMHNHCACRRIRCANLPQTASEEVQAVRGD